MKLSTPILLLGFNRPEKVKSLIRAISVNRPEIVLLAVDGPRAGNEEDVQRVRETQNSLSLVDWNANLRTRFRKENLGLRLAIEDAVSWATSEYGRVIVIEDDCVPGPEFIPVVTQLLTDFETNGSIAHINGYNVVKSKHLTLPSDPFRLTRYPESFAWATWESQWIKYDSSLDWALNCSIKELANVTGSFTAALRWKNIFLDAAANRINSWAYRWLGTIWSYDMKIIAPNRNLVSYTGYENGTHTRRRPKWEELPVEELPRRQSPEIIRTPQVDPTAERWTGKQVFGESIIGLTEGITASIALELIRQYERLKSEKLTRL